MRASRPVNGVSLLAALWISLVADPATAASFGVNPVRLELNAERPIGALTAYNNGKAPVVVQLEPTRWTQDQDQDVYAATEDLLATPPIFTLPAGGAQVIRVGLRRNASANASGREQAYRLYLREVPGTPEQNMSIRVSMRIGVPVFVRPPAAAGAAVTPRLQWRATRGADGKLQLTARNDGDAHIQITSLHAASTLGGSADAPAMTYILPGQQRIWRLDLPTAIGATLRLDAASDAGPLDAILTVGAKTPPE